MSRQQLPVRVLNGKRRSERLVPFKPSEFAAKIYARVSSISPLAGEDQQLWRSNTSHTARLQTPKLSTSL